MDTEKRKTLVREQKKEFILDQAQKLVFGKGFDQVTIDEIACSSGYKKRSIYLYFKDKEEILLHLVYRGQLILIEHIKKGVSAGQKGCSIIENLAKSFYSFSIAHREYFDLIMRYENQLHNYELGKITEDSPAARCQNVSVEMGDIITRAIAEAAETGEIKSDLTARQLMLILWGQTFGVMQILLMRQKDFSDVYETDMESLFNQYLAMLLKALS